MIRRLMSLVALMLSLHASSMVVAHPGHSHRKTAAEADDSEETSVHIGGSRTSTHPTEQLAMELPLLLAQLDQNKTRAGADNAPDMAKAFEAFVKLKAIKTRWDDRYFYVESNGIPDHRMMVGITAWQQQVPLPQKYFGENSWQIPLHPVPAKNPQSAKGNFLRGAIAVAANGIPIFNPLNNRGDDAYLFGELDEFGGHCGRADDYHYHIAPVHLEKTVGKGLPIAYALDGYPIFGYEEPDGSAVVGLDQFNGHKDKQGNYHYHATKKYPYLNGGFYGEVVERDGQVDPQPRAEPLRQSLPPMQGAKIVGFKETKPGSFVLTYDVKGKTGTAAYVLADDGSAKFTFTDTSGKATTETYQRRERRGGGGKGGQQPPPRPGEDEAKKNRDNPPRGDDRKPPRNDDRPPPPPGRPDDRPAPPPPRKGEPVSASTPQKTVLSQSESRHSKLVLSSRSVDEKGKLLIDCTCDGKGLSPAVEWKDAPKGTKSFAVSLWHTAPDQEKSYWLVYNIPANVTKLEQNSKTVGKLGLNDKRRAEYDPMCSKGPGVKTYHITVYALSSELKLTPDKANRANLLETIKGITLAEGTLDFQYERKR